MADSAAVALPATLRLAGTHVRLEPLAATHHAELLDVALDPELWRWTISDVRDADSLARYITDALARRARGEAVPFVIRDAASARAIGSTRYGNIDVANGRVEIGWTWVAARWQRTPANTEAKYLLLRYAFEDARLRRVEFKTDALNAKSRAALARIGAVEEGTLRSHRVTESGRVRDTVYFSILADEWPAVRAALEARLEPG